MSDDIDLSPAKLKSLLRWWARPGITLDALQLSLRMKSRIHVAGAQIREMEHLGWMTQRFREHRGQTNFNGWGLTELGRQILNGEIDGRTSQS